MMPVLYTREWWRFGFVMPGELEAYRRALVELRGALNGLPDGITDPEPRPITEALVTVDQARQRLRLDGDYPEADIELAICGASEAVMQYLKRSTNYTGSDGDDPAPPQVQNAVILLAGMFIRDPDGVESASNWEAGYLPRPIVSLLYPLRDPACE
jgi:hypothetical protein